jgi:hypothetical protein
VVLLRLLKARIGEGLISIKAVILMQFCLSFCNKGEFVLCTGREGLCWKFRGPTYFQRPNKEETTFAHLFGITKFRQETGLEIEKRKQSPFSESVYLLVACCTCITQGQAAVSAAAVLGGAVCMSACLPASLPAWLATGKTEKAASAEVYVSPYNYRD